MSKKTPLPPELGGHLSQDEYAKAAGRAQRQDFVRGVSHAIEGTSPVLVPKAEQAQVLRQMADQLEKADERTGVLDRSQKRVEERHPRFPFFSRIGDAQSYWNGKGKEPVARSSAPPAKDWAAKPESTAPRVAKDWNATPEPSREIKPLPERSKDRDWER